MPKRIIFDIKTIIDISQDLIDLFHNLEIDKHDIVNEVLWGQTTDVIFDTLSFCYPKIDPIVFLLIINYYVIKHENEIIISHFLKLDVNQSKEVLSHYE